MPLARMADACTNCWLAAMAVHVGGVRSTMHVTFVSIEIDDGIMWNWSS